MRAVRDPKALDDAYRVCAAEASRDSAVRHCSPRYSVSTLGTSKCRSWRHRGKVEPTRSLWVTAIAASNVASEVDRGCARAGGAVGGGPARASSRCGGEAVRRGRLSRHRDGRVPGRGTRVRLPRGQSPPNSGGAHGDRGGHRSRSRRRAARDRGRSSVREPGPANRDHRCREGLGDSRIRGKRFGGLRYRPASTWKP